MPMHWPDPKMDQMAALLGMAELHEDELLAFVKAHADIYKPRNVSFDDAGVKGTPPVTVISAGGKQHVIDNGALSTVQDWLLDIYDHDLGRYVPYQDFNKQYWDNVRPGERMYHSTDPEHLEAIKAEGLTPASGSRGLSNSGMGDAVFTSSEPELTDSYGPVLLAIDVGAMKADGYMPQATKEEPFEDSEMRAVLACKMGVSDYCPYSQYASEGLDQNTVAFYGAIPVKYITVVRQPAMAWVRRNCVFAQVGQYDSAYPLAGATVDGRNVQGQPPNQGSIPAALTDYEVLPGIREVNFSLFTQMGDLSYYSPAEKSRTKALADQMKASGWITPLIVVVDNEGPYVLEGGHRFDALRELGAKSFPAMVVIDKSQQSI